MDYQGLIHDLELRRDLIIQTIDNLKVLSTASVQAGEGTALATGPSLSSVLETVLSGASRPMKPRFLLEAIRQQGWKGNTQHPEQRVYQVLNRLKDNGKVGRTKDGWHWKKPHGHTNRTMAAAPRRRVVVGQRKTARQSRTTAGGR